jgi:hypothetical protein
MDHVPIRCPTPQPSSDAGFPAARRGIRSVWVAGVKPALGRLALLAFLAEFRLAEQPWGSHGSANPQGYDAEGGDRWRAYSMSFALKTVIFGSTRRSDRQIAI